MNALDEQHELRRKQWEDMLERIKIRARYNKASCKFSEVNYKLFRKPASSIKYKAKIKKRKISKHFKSKKNTNKEIIQNIVSSTIESDDIDISQVVSGEICDTQNLPKDHIIFDKNWACNHEETESTDSVDYQNYSDDKASGYLTDTIINSESEDALMDIFEFKVLKKDNDLKNIIQLIEKDLQSTLKELIINRYVSQVLELKSFVYWHARMKQEISRLGKCIPKNNIKKYMRYCFKWNNPNEACVDVMDHIIVNKLKSNLKILLKKREFAREMENENLYLKYCKKIHLEWRRLSEELPDEILLSYGSCVLFTLKELKRGDE